MQAATGCGKGGGTLYRITYTPISNKRAIAGQNHRDDYDESVVQRLTKPTIRVLKLLLDAPTGSFYGAELIEQADLGPGTLYPMLTRLETIGWLESAWEDVDPAVAGRPARRFYRLTTHGRVEAVAALERRKPATRRGLAEA
jgi:DNA-binding MarR family transcriptional regulator